MEYEEPEIQKVINFFLSGKLTISAHTFMNLM